MKKLICVICSFIFVFSIFNVSVFAAEAKAKEISEAVLSSEVIIEEAEGIRQAEILKAEGTAEAQLKVQEAQAKAIQLLKEAGADEAVLTLKAYEALKDLANGQSTKIVVPSNLQGLASLATTFKEITK